MSVVTIYNVITDELPIIITHLLWEPLGIFIIIELFIICKEQRGNSICARPFLSQEGQNQKIFGWEMHCLIPPWNSGGLRNSVKTYFGRSYVLRFKFVYSFTYPWLWMGVSPTPDGLGRNKHRTQLVPLNVTDICMAVADWGAIGIGTRI